MVMLIPVALIVVAALAGGVALNWDRILVFLKGKRLAVLGERGVGKTHLVEFLSKGSIPSEYKQSSAEKTAARRFQLRDLDLKIKDSMDVGGGQSFYAEWKELTTNADVVLYLLRADRLFARDAEVEERVRADLRHIGEWLSARKTKPSVFIFGTHCDLDERFATLTPDRVGDYRDSFSRLPVVSEILMRAGGTGGAKIVLGSMKTVEQTERLVYELFRQVAS